MSMEIKSTSRANASVEWHLGEEIPPEMSEKVVDVQLGGDELNLLLRAMELTRNPKLIGYDDGGCGVRVFYSKVQGFVFPSEG